MCHPFVHQPLEAVEDAVTESLSILDPELSIDRTGYFNHTYVPDLVLRWSELGRKHERPLYLRDAFAQSDFAATVTQLGELDPVVLALDPAPTPGLPGTTANMIAGRSTLVTTSAAVDVLARRDQDADISGLRRNPLGQLVRTSLMRGARGLLEQTNAQQVVDSVDRNFASGPEALEALDATRQIAQTYFIGTAAVQLTRAVDILAASTSGGVEGAADDMLQRLGAQSGQLTEAELRTLLPFILQQQHRTDDVRFWRLLGELVSLKSLEEILPALEGLDLTPLISANASRWSARRAQIVFNSEVIDAEYPQPRWSARGKVLRAEAGVWYAYIASDGSHLRGRPDSAPARWDDMQSALAQFDVTGVQLEGLSRTILARSDGSAGVYRDVAEIRSSLDDEYHVPQVELRLSRVDDSEEAHAATVLVDFPHTLVTADGPIGVGDLVRVALSLLAYRYPARPDDLQTLDPRS